MAKKWMAWLFAVLVLIGGGAYWYLSGKSIAIRITQQQIEQKLADKLPLTKTYFIFFKVTLDKPRVQLREGTDRVQAGMDITLNLQIPGSSAPLGGSVDVSAGLRYDPKAAAFFLTDPVVEQLHLQGLPSQYADIARAAVTQALLAYYAEHPIYTLSTNRIDQLAARMALKSVVVEGGELVVTLGL